jgi:hypothetical protein
VLLVDVAVGDLHVVEVEAGDEVADAVEDQVCFLAIYKAN